MAAISKKRSPAARSTTSKQVLLKHYRRSLEDGTAAAFIGAGLSVPSGFLDWRKLLCEIATELGLDVNRETDLIALAQYHVNERNGRAAINQLIVDEFERRASPNKNHRLLAELPIQTYWTTNYDHLLEDALRSANKVADVKINPNNLVTTAPRRDAVVYKMHGDVADPANAVITKRDYELFSTTRHLFTLQLQGDLISKTFLFLGFSFTDPNIDYILGRIRALVGENRREHYCIMRNEPKPKGRGKAAQADFDYSRRRLDLRINDLKSYGIQTVLVDDYSEITEVLAELRASVNRRRVFVSGAAHDFHPLGPKRLEALARHLGSSLVARNYNLVSGLGLGIGGAVAIGALETAYSEPARRTEEQVILRPFPQLKPAAMTLPDLWTEHRKRLLGLCRSAVFIAGNKLDSKDNVVSSAGMQEEFDILIAGGGYPIPIGASGWMAADFAETVLADPRKFYGQKASRVAPLIEKMKNARLGDETLVKMTIDVLDELNLKEVD